MSDGLNLYLVMNHSRFAWRSSKGPDLALRLELERVHIHVVVVNKPVGKSWRWHYGSGPESVNKIDDVHCCSREGEFLGR